MSQALSDTAALGDRGTSVLERSCSARDESRTMVPTSWSVREGGGAMALMPRCYAAVNGLIRLVCRSAVGMGALSDTAALGDRGTSVLERSCSARDESRTMVPTSWRVRAGSYALPPLPPCYSALI